MAIATPDLGRALPAGYAARPATLADVAAAVAMLNAAALATTGAAEHTVSDWISDWQTPGLDLAERSRLVVAPSGELAGCAVVWASEPFTHPEQWGRTHPAHTGRGLGTYLSGWGERLARKLADRAPEGQAVRLRSWASARETDSQALLTDQGYRVARHYLRMAIEFAAPPPAPEWPAGFRVRAFVPGVDDEATYRAIRESFSDSWDYVDRPFETGLKDWQHAYQTNENFDPSLWFLAVTGSGADEHIIGTAFCRWSMPEDPERAWIRTIGVRRAYRRQGLALALLQHCFVTLYARGRRRAALGVDAASPTGATRLYEKAGMAAVPEKQEGLWEKVLRAGSAEKESAER